jgi:hypothetical protein
MFSYVKVLKRSLVHNNYQYKIGLNDLDKPFEPEGTCVKGGLYYTTIADISSFFFYGQKVYVVKVPKFDLKGNSVKSVLDTEGNKFRTSCLELTDEFYEIPDFIKKFNILDDLASQYAATVGNLELVKYIYENGNVIGKFALSRACRHGKFEIVKYLINIGAIVDKVVEESATLGKNQKIIKFIKSSNYNNS